jgi:hypothetical protein
MKRRSLFAGFFGSLVAALAAEERPAHETTGIGAKLTKVTAGVHQYEVFTVTDPAAFLKISFPVAGMAFWNGGFLTPGCQYDIQGTSLRLRELPLSVGDTLTLVF